MTALSWCLDQQRQALAHMTPNHECNCPKICTPENLSRWISDAVFEECELLMQEKRNAKD